MDTQFGEPRIVRRDEVSRLTGLARATIYKKVADGSFPAPVSGPTRGTELVSHASFRLTGAARQHGHACRCPLDRLLGQRHAGPGN